MYDACFGFSRRPFCSAPQVDRYFPAASIESARTTLVRCVERGEGAGLVIGPAGTGKTLLCMLVAEQSRRTLQVAMLNSGRLSTRRALYQAILYDLGRAYRGMDEGELRLAVVDYLTIGDGSPRGMLLLADEAQTLPLRLLEEIRLLSNLTRAGQPLVRLVLAGGPALEERLASPKLDSLNQRLSARCYLEPLSRGETKDYIQSQINWAGAQGDSIFPEATCQCVFQATGGVVRLINQVCDHALLLAYADGQKVIPPARAEEAWADLQQLPAPPNAQPTEESGAGGVIEFGSLDDSDDDASHAASPTPGVFRVTQLDDQEMPTEAAEPAVQIHRIEQLLAETEDDFQPAGSIGPEVELCFDETPHPFREAFEQEEVVADRYAGAWRSQVGRPAQTPPVSESLPFGMPLPPRQEIKLEPRVPVSPPARNVLAEASARNRAAAVPTQEPAAAATVETSVAIVDEEPRAPRTTPPQQYRQLFARLRRG
ncbi:MAG: AAA family ATPase [Thermoguttaceae bacterium]